MSNSPMSICASLKLAAKPALSAFRKAVAIAASDAVLAKLNVALK